MKLRVKICLLVLLSLAAAGLVLSGVERMPATTPSGVASNLEREAPISNGTETCINCHKIVTPGIVEDWLRSRHAGTTPEKAIEKAVLDRRISSGEIPDKLKSNAVGCYECHALNPGRHEDNFEHYGFRVNVVVSPNDCRTCHEVEVEQYTGSKKYYAVDNLLKNPVYHALVEATIGLKEAKGVDISNRGMSNFTFQETCGSCHGTEVYVDGTRAIDTAIGPLSVPNLRNWPNQGVGRRNPDGTYGACTPCHPRHSFSIEVARKPHTCAQCHMKPDVPAWDVYKESKHGNLFLSEESGWDFESVPWVVGRDFKAPTCAVCHNSLMVTPQGRVVANRTHDFGSRLWVRLFGLIYSVPQPRSGDTYTIRNKDGLPLPATFSNEPATEYLIPSMEQERRKAEMGRICNSCHNQEWIQGHFEKLDSTIEETNRMTLEATKLMAHAWEMGYADRTNPFDEELELMWVRQWLFYGNSVRYASAMTGAPDYATFENGWWALTDNLEGMRKRIETEERLAAAKR